MNRQIIVRTGAVGYDLIMEAFEYQGGGIKRRYVGKKPMRLIKSFRKLFKSPSGRYYFKYKENENNNSN
jgi:hypothetical protein